ncbi:MAG: thioredoxin family protein [Bacilli bacterium]|nr:thioredoxin family protein [Bacilli bacterium]
MEKEKKQNKGNGVILAIKYIVPIVVALLIFLCFKLITGTYRTQEIDLDKYLSLVEGSKKSMIFVTSNDCNECDNTKELLEKMLQGSNIKTYELNIDNLSDNEKDKFMAKFEETREGITAPSLLMVKDNELVSSFYGPFDEDLIIEYLQNNELVKKINTDTNTDSSENNE